MFCRSTQESSLGRSAEEFSVDYDYLVIAMGARSNTFNTPGVVEHAHFLKVFLSCFLRLSFEICSHNTMLLGFRK